MFCFLICCDVWCSSSVVLKAEIKTWVCFVFCFLFFFLRLAVCDSSHTFLCLRGGGKKRKGSLVETLCGPWSRQERWSTTTTTTTALSLDASASALSHIYLSVSEPTGRVSTVFLFLCLHSKKLWRTFRWSLRFPAWLSALQQSPAVFLLLEEEGKKQQGHRESVWRKSWRSWTAVSRFFTGTGTSASCPRPEKSTVCSAPQ